MGERDLAILNLDRRMRLIAQLPDCLQDFRQAAAVDRVVAAQPSTISVEGQSTLARYQVTVGNELAAFANLAKAKVFQGFQDRDSEAVID